MSAGAVKGETLGNRHRSHDSSRRRSGLHTGYGARRLRRRPCRSWPMQRHRPYLYGGAIMTHGRCLRRYRCCGTWERSKRQNGVFVKSGIYSHETASPGAERKRTTKMRGVHPMNLGDEITARQSLIEAAPKAWAEDKEALEFPYRACKTFGAAVVSSKDLALHQSLGCGDATSGNPARLPEASQLGHRPIARGHRLCSAGRAPAGHGLYMRPIRPGGFCRALTGRTGLTGSWLGAQTPRTSRRR
jgi:hypothetical protein